MEVSDPASALRSDSVTRPGVQLHFTIDGTSGPYALILSGGPGEEVASMHGVAEHLRAQYRCIMLEQRGTGRSKLARVDASTINLQACIEDVEAVRNHLDAGKIILVGNSWGMMLALAYAGTHPDSVQAIVTLGSGPITIKYLHVFIDNQVSRLAPSDLESIAVWTEAAQQPETAEQAQFEITRAIAPAYFYDRAKALRYAAKLKPTDVHPEVTPAFLQAEAALDLRPLLKSITAPVLLLQGRQDIAGEANLYETHLLIKNSQLTFIEKCGHMPWLEQPEETWKITDAFLARAV